MRKKKRTDDFKAFHWSSSQVDLPFAGVTETMGGGVDLGLRGEVMNREFSPDLAGLEMPTRYPVHRHILLERPLKDVPESMTLSREPAGRRECQCHWHVDDSESHRLAETS